MDSNELFEWQGLSMVHWSITLAKDVANLNGWVFKYHILARKQISTMMCHQWWDHNPLHFTSKIKVMWCSFDCVQMFNGVNHGKLYYQMNAKMSHFFSPQM